jgi:D-arabinose 1-dehydrogenase-like Zn-dependent alcohol dehydrogenase
MGFKTVAIARDADKESLARKLGAQQYIDSEGTDAAAELVKLGDAPVILATVTSGKAMSAVLGGLGVNGKFIILGAPAEPLEVPAVPLIFASARAQRSGRAPRIAVRWSTHSGWNPRILLPRS